MMYALNRVYGLSVCSFPALGRCFLVGWLVDQNLNPQTQNLYTLKHTLPKSTSSDKLLQVEGVSLVED